MMAADTQTTQREAHIVVTGGAGFIGSHLCDHLIDHGATITCVDSLQTSKGANVAHLIDHPRFAFLQHDVTAPFDATADAILNLACPASPPQYQSNPVHTIKSSVLGAINVLDLARKNDCPVLQASTSEVYGDPEIQPQPETYWGHVNPVGLRACYDEGKRCAETLFFDYHRQFGVKIQVARIFNTYGPRMLPSDGRVVSNFIVQALRNEPLTLYGDGSQTRSFCYVSDMVEGLFALMDKRGETGPINLGNPAPISMRALAEHIRDLCGSKSPIVYQPLPQDDPKQREPDITRAKEVLGWVPSTPLDVGLRQTIAYLEQVLRDQTG